MRVFKILDLPEEIEDKPDAIELTNVTGDVTFDNVSVSYIAGDDARGLGLTANHSPSSDKCRLSATPTIVASRSMGTENTSFEIKLAQFAALAGLSGTDMTTLTYLLPRLYDPTKGSICIDGQYLRNVTQKSLVPVLGIVTQKTYLFHDSIKANLSYAKPTLSNPKLKRRVRRPTFRISLPVCRTATIP